MTNPLLFLPPMLMPLFFFTAFAGGLSAVSNVPGFNYGPGYTSFIFAFVLCQSAAFGGVFSGFSIAADFQFGFGRRLLLATPHRSALILGYGIVALIRAAITIGVVTLVGLAVGMNIDGGRARSVRHVRRWPRSSTSPACSSPPASRCASAACRRRH